MNRKLTKFVLVTLAMVLASCSMEFLLAQLIPKEPSLVRDILLVFAGYLPQIVALSVLYMIDRMFNWEFRYSQPILVIFWIIFSGAFGGSIGLWLALGNSVFLPL